MDWKIFFGTFGLMFLAELGDKTQLTALAFSAGSKSTWSVFFGASLALVLSTLLAVILGSLLNTQTLVPLSVIKLTAGILFLIFGVLIIREALVKPKEEKQAQAVSVSGGGLLARTALQSAAAFESASVENYLRAVEGVENDSLKELLNSLMKSEQEHAEKLTSLFDQHAESVVELPEVPHRKESFHPIDKSEQDIVEKLRQNELISAKFYEELAKASTIPSLKHVFFALAAEERGHAESLLGVNS